ncbi:peptidylprolyl isomerase [Sphaerotilus sp.]|uniref:peptidylprolyl isomerase n=1 Tax=Sphaerotilus sp. TaxID=2093942 RepID=UPI00286D7818|nr:peptidylprolyl isomerase [Sphaerotilus sp.]
MTELQTLSPDARAARSALMTPRLSQALALTLLLAASLLCGPIDALAQTARRSGDYIVAVVNQELVTNSEVQQRLLRAEQEAASSNTRLPDRDTLMRELLDQLIDERAQLGAARDGGVRVDETEIDRAVTNVAAQNKVTVPQLRERLRTEGMDFVRFRNNLRDQILLERVREREVQSRIRINDADIEAWLAEQREKNGAATEYNIAQILLSVPENAAPAIVTQRRQQGVALLQRLRSGEDFAALVREASDGSKDRSGEIGLRRADKLPDAFVDAVGPLRAGEVAPQVLRSGAGFHVLKLVERREAALTVAQQHARHILLRPGPKLTQDAAIRRLAGYKRQIEAGTAKFDDLARQHSEDGSAANGGDLGWASPGQFVPEFEQTMSALRPGSMADPVVSRFGVHLIQLLERRDQRLEPREQREMARAALREQKSEDAYSDWAREVRARAYVELRDPPGQ